MYLVNARLVVRNTRLDLRNAANSLQIEGKGVLPGDSYHWGLGTRNTRPYMYIYIYIHIYNACLSPQVFLERCKLAVGHWAEAMAIMGSYDSYDGFHFLLADLVGFIQ